MKEIMKELFVAGLSFRHAMEEIERLLGKQANKPWIEMWEGFLDDEELSDQRAVAVEQRTMTVERRLPKVLSGSRTGPAPEAPREVLGDQ